MYLSLPKQAVWHLEAKYKVAWISAKLKTAAWHITYVLMSPSRIIGNRLPFSGQITMWVTFFFTPHGFSHLILVGEGGGGGEQKRHITRLETFICKYFFINNHFPVELLDNTQLLC